MKKFLAFLLVFVMLTTMAAPLGAFAEAESDEIQAAEASAPEENTASIEEAEPEDAAPETVISNDAGDAVAEENSGAKIETAEELTLALQYDDYYDLSELKAGYRVLQIQTLDVSSYQVSGGAKTEEADTDVVVLTDEDETAQVINARGIGTAKLLLVPAEDYETAKSILDGTCTAEEPVAISAAEVTVTVEPAVLTILFMAGQSNMMGSCSAAIGYHPEDSVLCPLGEVYSTFSTCGNPAGGGITGISADWTVVPDPDSIVAGSLGADAKSINGTDLLYPLTALTSAGKGKTGPDSGLAYEWNQLSGDKVWCVNASMGGSSMAEWQVGEDLYNQAMGVFTDALKTYQAEIQSGHYLAGSELMFWLQGESDYANTYDTYYTEFTTTIQGFRDTLGIGCFGAISVRAAEGNYTDSSDLNMTAPRMVQYALANDENYPDIILASNANECWTSDVEVLEYFQEKYPQGTLTYPLRDNATIYSIPSTVDEVHADIHFSQTGHNENGIDAARNMFYYLNGGSEPVNGVEWRSADSGIPLTSGYSEYEGNVVETVTVSETYAMPFFLVYSTEPLSAGSLQLELSSGVERNSKTGEYTVRGDEGNIILRDGSGSVVSLVKVITSVKLETPVLKSCYNNTSGIVVKWASAPSEMYYIYRKSGSSGWQRIDSVDSTKTSYVDTDVTDGVTYTYTVRAYCAGKLSGYDTTGISCMRLSAPQLLSTAPTDTGITVRWKSATGATSYQVYRKEVGGAWKKIDVVTGTSYTDTGAKNAQQYLYTIRGVNGNSLGAYDAAGISAYRTATPTLTKIYNAYNGVRVDWKAVDGADSYVIYRKSGSSGWKSIGTTMENTYYLDTDVSSGATYTYTVRAKTDGVLTSRYDATGLTTCWLQRPKMLQASGSANVMTVTWEGVTGAESYSVYRKVSGGSWQRLATVSTTSYKDSTGSKNVEYTYTVVAKKGSYGSAFETGVTGLLLDTPTPKSIAIDNDRIVFGWSAVEHAEQYRVYRKVNNGGWQYVGTTTALSYYDTDITAGNTYTYTVRALAGTSISGYNTSGKSISY